MKANQWRAATKEPGSKQNTHKGRCISHPFARCTSDSGVGRLLEVHSYFYLLRRHPASRLRRITPPKKTPGIIILREEQSSTYKTLDMQIQINLYAHTHTSKLAYPSCCYRMHHPFFPPSSASPHSVFRTPPFPLHHLIMSGRAKRPLWPLHRNRADVLLSCRLDDSKHQASRRCPKPETNERDP